MEIEILIDRNTLPVDGQKVRFQAEDTEEWHEGEFDADADLFLLQDGKFYGIWHVTKWEAI